MKKPEEIKKGLELIGCNDIEEFLKAFDKGIDYDCNEAVAKDALAYIQQLEERNEKLENALRNLASSSSNARDAANKVIEDLKSLLAQVEREKDALMFDLQTAIYRGRSFNLDCEFCKDKAKPICEDCHWEWRGVCKENAVENNV